MEAVEAARLLPPQEVLEARVDADANDLEARLDLANLHTARREFRPALGQLLEIVARDRTFRGDIGRTRMIQLLELAHGDDSLVAEYRNRLSRLLF
jgi:putative thioredoxin